MACLQSIVVASLVAIAAAGETKYPEVVPGPGLPSLAQLGLTSAQLYQMGTPKSFGTFSAQWSGCGPVEDAYTNVNDAIACFHYLDSLGDQDCFVRGGAAISQFCKAGDAQITGQSVGPDVSVPCREAGQAALWVIDHCTRPDQSVAGFQNPSTTTGMVVDVANIRY
ncbi:hypothetical protein VHEMI02945 [[Torrubiella] hemipterigena]|uniref:Ecp2 effector protein domain-containing protein n=1 Tax=[Torrubiella] hemipterigena TaxID=1531966 RepID=A0A0A1TBY7_9HYPO|nr:hypothetical protein VHEMI02945 [[Torrubiella] hemipterigena]